LSAVERHPIFAALYDSMLLPLDRLSFRPHRRRIAAAARGRTLEIGIGTGLNLALYEGTRRIVGIEPDPEMLNRARRRAASLGRPVDFALARAEALPFRDGAFDSVIATLVFCTIADTDAAARESCRVLAPRGEFHFLEHVRSRNRWVARFQDAVTPFWKRLLAGCHPNRETLRTFEHAGLEVERGERPGAFLVCGSAHATTSPLTRSARSDPRPPAATRR
jgi:ubiquinone/menaquinone biosynthesis C-methylase UbiE